MRKLYLLLILLPAGLAAQIQINNGASLVVSGSASLVLNNGKLVNNGNFDGGNGWVWFTGSADTSKVQINGSGSTLFNNLVISKSAGEIMVNQDISVAGAIILLQGYLLLNGHMLDLGSTGTITGERDQANIFGFVGSQVVATRTFKSVPSSSVNPGNVGFEFTCASNPQWVQVIRSDEEVTLPGGALSIERNYTVNAGANYGLDATIRLHYLDFSVNGANENDLMVYGGSDLTSGWLQLGKDTNDAVNNWVQVSGIDHFNRYTLSTGRSVLRKVTTTTGQSATMAVKAMVYPNPAHDQCTVVLNSNQAVTGTISLYDEMGHLLQTRKINYHPGINQLTWNLQGYANGVYYLVSDNKAIGNRLRIIKE